MKKGCLGVGCTAALMLMPAASAEATCGRPTLPSPRFFLTDIHRHDRLPYYKIAQSNGWTAYVRFSDHRAQELSPLDPRIHSYLQNSGDVSLQSFSADSVRFIASWDNGTAGVYTGTIDDHGFISGDTVDRFHPSSRAQWHMLQLATCG